MELELGLKITRTRDDVTSIFEYQLAKDRAGPVFQSRETNTMFILTAHLKGYKRNNIDIKISEDGSKISISGQKPIQEMLMMGCVMYRKEVEITGFNKVFKIPEGVVLDRIKANYDEEEWILKIVMPKFVKGICGARIEEVKEEESDRGRSEVEKSEADHILNGIVGETSQKGSKESEVQETEDSESLMEKVGGVSDKKLDDAKREIIRETIQKEVEESNMGNKDGNGKSVREKVGMEGHPTMKISELEQNVGVYISQKIGDTSQDKESEVQKMKESENVEKNEGGVSNKMLDDGNGDITEEMIQKDIEESKLGIEDGSELEQNAGAPIMQIIGDTSQRVSNESVKNLESQNGLTEEDTCGESKQKEFGEPKCEAADRLKESVAESSIERFKVIKTSELDQNVADHIPRNIGGISQEEFKKSRIQQMEKTESIEGKMNGGESERRPVEANKDIQKNIFGDSLHTIQKDIIKPKIETEDGDQECVSKKAGKVGFDSVITIKEEFPKQLPKATPEESEGLNVSKMKETKDVKEAVVKRKGKEIEYFVEKGESEEPKRMYVEERKDIQKEIMQEKNGIKDSNQQDAMENTVKGGFKISNSTADELPIQVGEKLIEGSKGFKVAKKEELKEVTKEAMTETESLMEKLKGVEPKNRTEESSRVIEKSTITETLQKELLWTVQENLPKKVVEEIAQDEKDKIALGEVNLKGEGSTKMHVELGEVLEEGTTRERIEKEIGEPKLQSSEQLSRKDNVYFGVFDGSKSSKSPEIGETEIGTKTEQHLKKVNGDKYEKMQVEENGGFRKDLTRETTPKEIEVPKIQTMEKDKSPLQEEMSKGILEVNKALKEEFPKKMVDSLANKREGVKDTKIEEAKGVNEEGAEIEQFVKKVKGEKHGKIQVESNGGLRKDITSETTRKEREDPKIPTKEMDQQRLQEKMSKGRYEASTIARDFPMQMIESLVKTREGPKDKEIEAAEEVKEEVTKLKSEETKVESTAKEKCPQSEGERINQTLKEVAEVKHPKASEIGTPESELQSTKGPTKEVEQGSAKHKTQKTKLLPPKIQSKETHESINESVNQDILKPKKAKEVGEGGQSIYNTESTKEVVSIEDLVAKPLSAPWLPSTQQSEVDERDKLYEGCKAEYDASLESQKGDPTKDMKSLVEMKKNQEPKQRETLKPEIPLEKQLKRGQVTRKDEFHKGQKVGETMQEETERPKNKIDDRDQQYVQRDVGKGVGKVETLGKEMHKEETLKPEIPLEKQLKRGQVTRKDEFHKGQKVGETMQEETERPKNKIDDRDQQYVQRDVGKGVGKVETLGKEMHKEETLKPEIPLEKQLKRGQVTRKDEFHKGQIVGETMQEETERPKNKIDDTDQQYVQRDVGKGVGKVETLGKEMHKEETLKPEIPLEKQLKRGQVTRKDEFHKGQIVGETMQEETERPKNKIDDTDQQYVQRDVGKGVGKVETLGKEMHKEENVADAGLIVERMETERDLKATLEREKYITTQNVNDEKPRIEEEIIKADIEKVDKAKHIAESMKTTQEKEHPRKSEVVKKEAEPLQAISSLQSVTSMEFKEAGPKNEVEELHQKELSPLTGATKRKEPIEIEKPIMERKFPKTREDVPESRDREQYGYGTEDIKEPKIAVYQGAKPSELQSQRLTQQSIDEESRKSENVVEALGAYEASKESPKKNIVENESLQPQILENQCFEDEQKVDGQEEAFGQCGLQEINQEETKGPKILIEDRGQKHVQDNNDKKEYQTAKGVEEEWLKEEQGAEIVLDKREGPKVAKSEEVKEASRELLKRERGKTTQTAEEKKPKMKEITQEFEKASGFKQVTEKKHETREKEHQRESEEVTSKMKVEPPTMIEITPNKGIEKSQTEEMPPLPMEIQRKEPQELSWPTMDYEIPRIEEVQQEKEGERLIHALEATTSKEEGLAQATATHSKAKSNVESKGEIDKPKVNQLQSPSTELLSKEPCELDKFSMKEDNSKNKDSKTDVQESTKSKTDQEDEQIESIQPASTADQQCINKDHEESHRIHENEEEKACKEQKECKKKRDDTKSSKKLFVPLVIAGSALLVSLIVIFVRHRRARKRQY